jgi:hypothetical protein
MVPWVNLGEILERLGTADTAAVRADLLRIAAFGAAWLIGSTASLVIFRNIVFHRGISTRLIRRII